MSSTSPIPELELRMSRVIKAPREKVFALWTQEAHIAHWWLKPGFTDVKIDVDLRVGGEFRFAFTTPEGQPIAAYGSFRAIEEPERIVQTWNWDGHPGGQQLPDTVLTVEFHARGGETELVLIHSGFPAAEPRDQHSHGWTICLDRLVEMA